MLLYKQSYRQYRVAVMLLVFNLRFNEIINIIWLYWALADAELVENFAQRIKTGPGCKRCRQCYNINKEDFTFMADEVSAFVKQQYPSLRYDNANRSFDVELIMTE
jgi:hypothetical protein